jgi:hypothetical protein
LIDGGLSVRILALWILMGGASLLLGQQAVVPAVIAPDITGLGPNARNEPANAEPADGQPEGRIFGVIPNNKTVPPAIPLQEPLSVRQKFDLATKDTTDPFTVVLAAFYAGVAQWQDDFPTWGQGSAAYGKRFGAAFGDQVVGNYLTEAILPVLFHEDPRYFRKGIGLKRNRIAYALSRTFITRTDRGKDRFNYSEVVGNGIAAGVSNFYYPATERSMSETAEKYAVQMVSDSAFNVLLEFWPDLKHAIFKR